MFRVLFRLIILISIWNTCNGFSEFYKGLSSRFHEPPFTGYSARNIEAVIEGYIDQRVDHFDSNNNATFKMVNYLSIKITKKIHGMIFFSELNLFVDLWSLEIFQK